MDQKERILALVKEGTLSMEEALELLEHLDEPTKETTSQKINDSDQVAMKEQIDDLTNEKEALQKEQTITKQRQRELEVLKEFDDLTPELEQDLQNYQTKATELQQEMDLIDEQLSQLTKQNHHQWQDMAQDLKQTIQDTTDKITTESEKLFENSDQIKDKVSDFVKGVLNHYTVRSVGDYFGIEWSKATTQHQSYEIDATDLKEFALQMPEGEWSIKTHSKPTVYIEGQWAIYGDPKELAEEVEAWHQAKMTDHVLKLTTTSGQVAFKGTMYLPDVGLDSIMIKLGKGQLSLDHVNVDKLVVEGKVLQCALDHLKAQKFYLNLINGKLTVDQSFIDNSTLSVIKGDVRYTGPVANIQSNVIHGNHYITKMDETSSAFKLSNVKGDVKVALLETVGLKGKVKQTSGKVLERLLNGAVQPKTSEKVTYITRQVPQETATVTLEASITAGDVYLKDHHLN